jgi:hypothetical protein
MSRIEYRSKEFPELARLRMQARGVALVQGKTMAQVFIEALQLWMEHNCGEGMNKWYQLVGQVDEQSVRGRKPATGSAVKKTLNNRPNSR